MLGMGLCGKLSVSLKYSVPQHVATHHGAVLNHVDFMKPLPSVHVEPLILPTFWHGFLLFCTSCADACLRVANILLSSFVAMMILWGAIAVISSCTTWVDSLQ